MNKKFTGICICGHNFNDHHQTIVFNPKPLIEKGEEYRIINDVIAGECEADFSQGYPLKDNPCTCKEYIDKGWINDK
jgi:hypothetical protein